MNKIIKTSVMISVITVTAVLIISFIPVQDATKWVAPASADKTVNPVGINDQSIAAGKILFAKNCEQCHGKKGRGDGPKSAELEKQVGDLTAPDFVKQSDGAIFWKITQGRKPMPTFKKDLTDNQRWQLVAYVRELGKAKAKK
jgi:mono/diheme cytochrome c family protein